MPKATWLGFRLGGGGSCPTPGTLTRTPPGIFPSVGIPRLSPMWGGVGVLDPAWDLCTAPGSAAWKLVRSKVAEADPRSQQRDSRPRRTHPTGPHSQGVPRGASSTQTERSWWEPGLGQGLGSPCYLGTESLCGETERSGDGGWGWLHNNVIVLNAIEVCT